MALSADTAEERVAQLVALTERLTELIAAEAQAFESHRPQDAAPLVEETSRLANLYRHESARVRANPDLVAPAPLEARTRLMRATETRLASSVRIRSLSPRAASISMRSTFTADTRKDWTLRSA